MISQATVTSYKPDYHRPCLCGRILKKMGKEKKKKKSWIQNNSLLKKKKKKINGGSDETPLAHRPLSRYYQFKKNYKFNSDTTGMQMVVVVCG